METNDTTYFDFLKKLRSIKPKPSNAEDLTNSILDQINKLEHNRYERKPVIVILRPLLSVAASFLLGLFFYQQFEPTPKEIVPIENSINAIHSATCTNTSPKVEKKNLTLAEAFSLYTKLKSKQLQERNSRLYNTSMSLASLMKK